ncbi:hypothetical protein E2562_019402 [Oryza meyeriana var. granulata]|uniref:Uncharacterized protein n=1 Tax=Oryza meyeriana var. granulata TaxID=110450 RepID=A0A6G1BKM5_9ORYZ|nr:hypothetical protein E2562_019402 [Oryza meyeriana var. granulata]
MRRPVSWGKNTGRREHTTTATTNKREDRQGGVVLTSGRRRPRAAHRVGLQSQGNDGGDCPAAVTWKQSKAATQCTGEEQVEAAVRMVTMTRVDVVALADGDKR